MDQYRLGNIICKSQQLTMDLEMTFHWHIPKTADDPEHFPEDFTGPQLEYE